MDVLARLLLTMLGCAALTACEGAQDERVVNIAYIGDSEGLFTSGLRLGPAAQHVRAATAEGLVTHNEQGEIVPGLAESWIVTDDGLSYIFRLRNTYWPIDGGTGELGDTRITGQSVRDALVRTQSDLAGTSLGHDLDQIDEILAIAGRVVEIRLESPMPDFLQLLAQPELGIRGGSTDSGTGPMSLTRQESFALLDPLPPAARGVAETPNWEEQFREIRLTALPVAEALDAFADGRADVVLGGTLANLPLADTGPLSRGTVRLDPAIGIFGLRVTNSRGILADRDMREALALAIDRSDLLTPFNIAGWLPATRIAPPAQLEGVQVGAERWADLTIEQRRGDARRKVLIWRAANDRQGEELVPLKIALPAGPGSELLLRELNADLAPIGIVLEPIARGSRADLRLVDRVARYPGLRWYLNQFNCGLKSGFCSALADALAEEALTAPDPQERADLLAEAEATLVDANAYIPLGSPVRWSLVRGQIDGFAENPWNLHPLFPMARRPI